MAEQTPVAVVTGGASGIGRAVVTQLLRDGWRVAVWDIAPAPETDTAALHHHVVDVCDVPAVDGALEAVERYWGNPSLLVHSAAIAPAPTLSLDTSVADFRAVLEVDLLGAFVTAKAVAAGMRRAGGGSIVLVSSAAGLRARPGLSAYGAAKAGVIQLAKVLAVELAEFNIRVNCVSPGVTLTPLMLESWGTTDPAEAFRQADAQAPIPLGRLVTAEEVATPLLHLALEATGVTAHNLVIDGGRSA